MIRASEKKEMLLAGRGRVVRATERWKDWHDKWIIMGELEFMRWSVAKVEGGLSCVLAWNDRDGWC